MHYFYICLITYFLFQFQCDLNRDGKITEEEFLKAGLSIAELFELESDEWKPNFFSAAYKIIFGFLPKTCFIPKAIQKRYVLKFIYDEVWWWFVKSMFNKLLHIIELTKIYNITARKIQCFNVDLIQSLNSATAR